VPRSKKSYRAPAQQWALPKTFVTEKSQKGILPGQLENGGSNEDKATGRWPVAPGEAREKERALPIPSDNDKNREKWIGPTYYNKNDHTPYRTKSTPGEQYGHPTKYDYNYVRRRHGVTATLEDTLAEIDRIANLFPKKRQQNQKGVSRRYHSNYYRINGPKIKQKARKRWLKKRLDPVLKRRKKMMRQYPNKYKRRGYGPYDTPAQRTRAWREKNKEASLLLKEAHTIMAANWSVDWGTHVKRTVPPEQLEQNMGPTQTGVPRKDNSKQKGESLRAPDLNRKPQKGLRTEQRIPGGSKMPSGYGVNNPTSGSGKVIPLSYYTDFANHSQAIPDSRINMPILNQNQVKVAKTVTQITKGLSKEIKAKGKLEKPRLSKVSGDLATWKVGEYTILVQFDNPKIKKSNLKLSCTCPAWQWQGPEHWAKKGGYLYGTPRGSATKPKEKDPDSEKLVCKHVYAVLQNLDKIEEKLKPKAKKKTASVEKVSSVFLVAWRYLNRTRSQ
jgi:hypothetical protein